MKKVFGSAFLPLQTCFRIISLFIIMLSCIGLSRVYGKGNNPLDNHYGAPVFSAANYSYSLADNVAPGTPAGSVNASDPEGDAFTYAITAGNSVGTFSIDSVTGLLKTVKVLNHHTQNVYNLTIKATDAGGAAATVIVTINIAAGTTVPTFSIVSWGTVANQPYTVSESQGEVINGKLYTFGGFDSQKSGFTPTSRAYVYDPVANTWTPIAPMPPMNGTTYGGVTHAGFTNDGTDIYFAGGYTSNASGTGQIFGTKEVWKYIVAENRYERLPNLPVTISAGQLEYLNGKLYHIAGTNSSRTTDLGSLYVLDLNNLAAGWKSLASLPNPRQHSGSAVYEGKIYYIGGQHGHDDTLVTQKDVHQYDPVTNIWTKMADLPVPAGANGRGHISSATIVIGNQIIVMAGEIKEGTSTNLVSSYSPETNSWTDLTPLTSTRYSGIAANLGGKIYYTGGSNTKTTFKGLPNTQQVINFTLINADTDQPIQTLSSGSTLNIGTLPTRNLAIRANANFSTGSVKFNLTGAETRTVSDSTVPFALFGDSSGNFNAWTPTIGSYTLKGTPYTATNGTGTAGTAYSVKFTVIDQPQQVTSFTLINADTEQPIVTFSGDSTINLAALPTRNLAVRANTNVTTVGSVVFNLTGAETKNFIDNVTPFAPFDDNRGDYYDWAPTIGSYTIKATPYTATGGVGTIGIPLTLQLNVVDQPSHQITGFTLMNADTDEPIQPLTGGSTLNLGSLFTRNLAIKAVTVPETVDSVVFSLNGAETKNSTDNASPYSLLTDNNGDYPAWTPSAGYYTLKATPYITINGVATAGTPFIISFAVTESLQTKDVVLSPVADAYVRDGSYATTNYGFDTTLQVRGTTSVGSVRQFYLKFPVSGLSDVVSAKLRLYGRNTESTATITTPVYGVDNDSWTETGLTWNNAPASPNNSLGRMAVNSQRKYYEVDVTDFAKAQFAKDRVISFLVKDSANKAKTLSFNSRENVFFQPQLVITTSATAPSSNSSLFVENLDKFPSNDDYAASRIQKPWGRDSVLNTNHDTLRVRIHNKGINQLIVSNFLLSNKVAWKIISLKGVRYDSTTALPLTISPGTYADLQVKFIPTDSAIRVRIISDELSIVSNDDKTPIKTLYLRGLFQREGEGSKEPRAQEIITAFGFKTKTGFSSSDPDKGTNNKPKGDEVLASYLVRVDASKPVTVRQMSAYHGCCDVQAEYLKWYPKGATGSLITASFHISEDAQTFLPRRTRSTTYSPSEGSFNPTTAFGFKIGTQDWSDTLLNPGKKIGIRIWKAINAKGLVIPNTYIISNDYLGTDVTNYDYNDNMYYVTNVRPELGPASVSNLTTTPSAVDFGEQLLNSQSSFSLNLQSLGQIYTSGAQDPAISISAVSIVGESKGEFTATMPAKTVLNAGESTSLTIGFNPVSQGLKIADLLIYYNNAASPYRVPLYGIAKAGDSTVIVHYRIKSGSSSDVVVNGKNWSADTPYAFDNLEPFSNSSLTQIKATDEDALYLREQSSNSDKKPFRYEMPLANGTYWVRLHFAELYWGTPGAGLTGGPGSRVMSINIEGEQKLVNLDVAQEVGSASAIVKNIPVTVNDGKLNVNFSAMVNRPMVCAIEVYQFIATPVLVDKKSTTIKPLEETSFEKLRVYPNPLHQRFTIEFPGSHKGTATLQLLDIAGRSYELGKVYVQVSGAKQEMDVSKLKLTPGIYFLKVYAENGKIETIKLLVQ